MGYYDWISDQHGTRIEIESHREVSKPPNFRYKYSYYVTAAFCPEVGKKTIIFNIQFSSQLSALNFFRKFAVKFKKLRNDKYNKETKNHEFTPVSIENMFLILQETIQESNFSKRKIKKINESAMNYL